MTPAPGPFERDTVVTSGRSTTETDESRAAAVDVAVVLTYYRPYVSGLSEAARLVAEGLAARGRRVEVVCTRHDPSLPEHEVLGGVTVHRAPVVARLSKGTISPAFLARARALIRRARLVHLHLPLLEAGPLAVLARRAGRPLVVTYQCDVVLGAGVLDRAVVAALDASHRAALRRADVVCPSSADYLAASRVAAAAGQARRVEPIRPPAPDRTGGTPRFRRTGGLHVGFLGRIVAEKGLDVLLDAFARLPDRDARLLLAGEHERVAGGSVLAALRARIDADRRVVVSGFLPDADVADWLASLDVLALPSVSALEAYGIVQVEAMGAGVPVVATDRPGVRVPVQTFGLGRLVPAGDPGALAAALVAAAAERPRVAEVDRVRAALAASDPIAAYAAVVDGLLGTRPAEVVCPSAGDGAGTGNVASGAADASAAVGPRSPTITSPPARP